jgi:hypothetical protein
MTPIAASRAAGSLRNLVILGTPISMGIVSIIHPHLESSSHQCICEEPRDRVMELRIQRLYSGLLTVYIAQYRA